MISGISSINSVITPSINRIVNPSKITYPVRPSSIHAHFKHIVGIPSWEETKQISVTKLRALDNLIDHLSRMRSGGQTAPVDYNEITMDNIDMKINELENELKSSYSAAMPFNTGLLPENGMIIDFYA